MAHDSVNRKLLVRDLTAVAVVLFEMVEIVEDLYPLAAQYLTEAMESVTQVVDNVVVDAYRIEGTIIPRPRILNDSPHDEAAYKAELIELEQITAALAVGAGTVHGPHISQAADHISTAVNVIVLMDRLNLEPEEGEPVNPWRILRSIPLGEGSRVEEEEAEEAQQA